MEAKVIIQGNFDQETVKGYLIAGCSSIYTATGVQEVTIEIDGKIINVPSPL